ncbi:MAG: hydantoinase/oxoprolinase family protein [Solirubrobacteraceae bacterium MAG38_C4-C5]|nr:hydantoinase/oxoprolinase family protein [Candidatus Siliceabacter maunaloa]
MLLGVDVGGTFTDAVIAFDGRLVTAKAPTTPDDQSEGVLAAVDAALARAGARAQDVEAFAHGMTVATNALLEGRGARTVLAATEGFTDVVELGRQARADLYRLCVAHPAPLVPADRRVAVPERMGPDGPLRALDAEAADAVAERIAALEPEAVAVCLLHADRHPEHERALGEALARRLPGVHVSLSHEVVGTFREFERFATTEVDAALSPLLAAYLRRMGERADAVGLPAPLVMQSSGGLADGGRAARHAALTVLSGPAGGAAAAALLAARSGREDLLCFDMGGTSCDVCVVEGGSVRESAGREVGGRPLALPMVDVHTVGAGGGSIAWRDGGGALRTGPRSAGADPGPACYGRGGTLPTVTDANLMLGRLDADSPLAGSVALDRHAAERAVGGLAQGLGLDPLACAEGMVRVASAEMLRALRVMTVEQGIDPRAFALLAFGGAGGLHAAALADELGMGTVLCPRASGVLSALGLAAADRRATAQRTVLASEPSAEEVAAVIDALGEEAERELGVVASARLSTVLELRYAGQAHELAVRDPEADEVRARFEALHEERYGYRDVRAVVELVTARVTASLPGAELTWAVEARPTRRTRRTVVFDGAQHDAQVARGEPAPDEALAGPAIWELPEATVAVPPGWRAQADALGTLVLERAR